MVKQILTFTNVDFHFGECCENLLFSLRSNHFDEVTADVRCHLIEMVAKWTKQVFTFTKVEIYLVDFQDVVLNVT